MTKEERELLDAWRLNGYFQGDGGIVMDKALTRQVDALIDRLARVEEKARAVVEADGPDSDSRLDDRLSNALDALRAALNGEAKT